jgi:hypothetical protein
MKVWKPESAYLERDSIAFTVHRSPFAVHRSLFTVHLSPLTSGAGAFAYDGTVN